MNIFIIIVSYTMNTCDTVLYSTHEYVEILSVESKNLIIKQYLYKNRRSVKLAPFFSSFPASHTNL